MVPTFSLQPIKDSQAGEVSQTSESWESQLLFGDKVVAQVEGLYLEAQLEVNKGYLLFLSENCPFEECLHIYYLDSALKICDQINLGVIYAPGTFKLLTLANNSVEFQFFGQDRWRLTVLAQPRRDMIDMSFISSRPLQFLLTKHYLLLEDLTDH